MFPSLQLAAGHYRIEYRPNRPYLKTYSTRTPIAQIIENEQAKSALAGVFPMIAMLEPSLLAAIGEATLREMAATPYLTLSNEQLDEIDRALSSITR